MFEQLIIILYYSSSIIFSIHLLINLSIKCQEIVANALQNFSQTMVKSKTVKNSKIISLLWQRKAANSYNWEAESCSCLVFLFLKKKERKNDYLFIKICRSNNQLSDWLLYFYNAIQWLVRFILEFNRLKWLRLWYSITKHVQLMYFIILHYS